MKGKVWLIVLGILLVVVFGFYNGIVGADEECNKALGNIESALQRRFDLIPNLVATVKGYAQHEESVLTEVTELRSQWAKAQSDLADAKKHLESARTSKEKEEASEMEHEAYLRQLEVSGGLGSAFGRLMVISEAYPELKANESFIQLQDELAGTENRISVERNHYNEAVQKYNVKIRGIPGCWFANFMGMEPRKPFEAAAGAEKAPTVEF